MALTTAVQIMLVPFLTVIVSPGVPVPVIAGVVLLVLTGVVGPAGCPLTVAIVGVPIAPAGGTGLVAVLPDGSVVTAGPVGGTAGLVGTQTTIPVAVAGVGVQVVPGIVTVLPGVTPVQVTVLLTAVVHVGATGGVMSLM